MPKTLARSLGLALSLGLASVSVAQADELPPPPKVSDAALGVAKDHHVTLTLPGNRVLTGVPASWDAESVTLIEDGTRRIVTVARIDVQSIQMVEAPTPVSPTFVPQLAAPMTPLSTRHVGLQIGAGPGNVILDVDYGHFYGFVGTSIGYPIIFSGSDQAQFFAFAVGAGGTWRVSPHSNWKFDLVGTLTPTWWGGFSAGIGISAGFHYTSPSGFTAGIQIPLIGAAPGCNKTFGDDNYDANGNSVGCQKVNGGASLLGNYYLQAAMSLPLLTVGYRF